VVAWLGLQRLGAVPVPITPIYTSFDLQYVAQDTGARAVICQDRNYGYVKRAMPGTQIEHVVTTNVMDLLPSWKQVFGFLADKAPKGKVEKAPFVHSFRSLLQGVEYAGTGKSSEDIAEILYTGGTTKHPKGVPINPRLFLVSAEEQLNVRTALFPKEKDGALRGNSCAVPSCQLGRNFRRDTAQQSDQPHRGARVLPHDS
jgi:long-chain acyl-CoA synthetase